MIHDIHDFVGGAFVDITYINLLSIQTVMMRLLHYWIICLSRSPVEVTNENMNIMLHYLYKYIITNWALVISSGIPTGI